MDDEVKQVKVDNWGIYFLQRLKHFFNRTDYCDLTLQFQDRAQLKVHRLVLSACTEYFEILERTCEMYEDCLVMPDDLQADVVVPIVNFMYTGQLEFKMDLLEKLYQTSQVMTMPVLTKLLEAHRDPAPKPAFGKKYSKIYTPNKQKSNSSGVLSHISNKSTPPPTNNKRSFSTAFVNEKHVSQIMKPDTISTTEKTSYNTTPSIPSKTLNQGKPKPTRYDLPEELENDAIFDNSFSNISYESKPLIVHPDAVKHYKPKRKTIFSDASTSKASIGTLDIVEYKKLPSNSYSIFDDGNDEYNDTDLIQMKNEPKSAKLYTPEELFDQVVESNDGPKVTLEATDSQQIGKLDHAKIISEVLKKYPHLVNSNKNIKLKILNTDKPKKEVNKLKTAHSETIPKPIIQQNVFESDVLDSAEAARLIALGAENITGPWICLICGTPGKAIHFQSYYQYRRHLVEVHKEKPCTRICEYCGIKTIKRNYLMHHLYTRHGIPPPPQFHFPKCNHCNYIALTEGYLVKHKMSHQCSKKFRCNVCVKIFPTSNELLQHIKITGHKYTADKKSDLQCIYCKKVFIRETNLYTHLKIHHKARAKHDGIIDDSDEEMQQNEDVKPEVKYERSVSYSGESDESQSISHVQITTHKLTTPTVVNTPSVQRILNNRITLNDQITNQSKNNQKSKQNEISQDPNLFSMNTSNEEIIMIDNQEYIMRDNTLIIMPKNEEYILSDNAVCSEIGMAQIENQQLEIQKKSMPTNNAILQHSNLNIKKSINQPIQIVVSSESEYKALMSSNHSIIFDDIDASKTLTVLSTPHTSTIDTSSINLENNSNSDMVIIPDNYQINAPGTSASAEDSNIVVVYSHPLEVQNKSYHIMSNPIQDQFVKSSVITQNYGTSTTTPVISTQPINSQQTIAGTWQTEESEESQSITDIEPQMEAVIEETVTTPADCITSDTITSNLPEVQISPDNNMTSEMVNQEPESYSVQVTHEDLSNVVANNEETIIQVVEQMHTSSSTPMEVDIESTNMEHETEEHCFENSNNQSSNIANDTNDYVDNNSQGDIIPQNEASANSETSVQQHVETPVVCQTLEHVNNAIEQVQGSNEISTDIEQNINSSETCIQTIQAIVSNEPIVQEQIQNLTSEWSEDEGENIDKEASDSVTIENATIPVMIEKNILPITEVCTTEQTEELEESIENIQLEVNKITQSSVIKEMSEGNNVCQSKENQQIAATVPVITTEPVQEKLTSLLNDWEDSQEDNIESNNRTTDETEKQDQEGNAVIVQVEPEKVAPVIKDDKIKTLVSDWDDEEEEK